MTLSLVTFRIDKDLARKLKALPKRNRRFNNQSEILRTLVTLYIENPSVKHAVHSAMIGRYVELFGRDDPH